MWKPERPKVRPIYRGIVAALKNDIAAGRLSSGERLPTHRELSQHLGVTIGTITKAFTEAERGGLVVSRVGRGSYVLQFPETIDTLDSEPKRVIDLSINTVTIEPFNNALNRVFGALSRRKSLYGLLEYHPVPGIERHRVAGAKWMEIRGLSVNPDRIIVCNGAQLGLMAALATVTRPGSTVLTEYLNYGGVKRLADLFRLDIRGVPIDHDGMRPDALLDLSRGNSVGAILCSPTLHNPTNARMPLERRKEILNIATRLDAMVIENDSYGHISGDTTPTMTALMPERCIYICSTSKSIAPGLRIGFLSAPADIVPRLITGIYSTSWTSPSLMGEITSNLIETGMAEKVLVWHRKEAIERVAMAREIFKREDICPDTPTYHLWVPLPAPWRTLDFVAEVRSMGTLISPSDFFAVDRSPAPHAVRISLGSVSSRARLAEGLRAVARALEARPTLTRSAV